MKKFAIILMLLTGCRAEMPTLNAPQTYAADYSFAGGFEVLWHGLNNNYLFWSIDPTDWDAVYREWQPRFAELDEWEDEDDAIEQFHGYLTEITSTLVDGHFALLLDDASSQVLASRGKSGVISPAHQRITSQWGADADTPFWRKYPQQMTAAWSALSADKRLSMDDDSGFLVVAINIPAKGGVIPYIYFSGFELAQRYEDPEFQEVMDLFFTSVLRPDARGAIIDVRGNGGGDIQDLNFLMGRFITQPLTFAYTRGKAGEGRLDYTPWMPFRITPVEGENTDFRQPVVILTDIGSMSCAEMTTMAVRALPHGNGRSIGQITAGGQGVLTPNTFHNGGQFSTIDFILGSEHSALIKWVYTASVMLRTVYDGQIWEGKGLAPDQQVPLDIDMLQAGHDSQIEAAIRYMSTNN